VGITPLQFYCCSLLAGLRITFGIKAEDFSTDPGINVLVGKAVAVFRVVAVGQEREQQQQQQQALDWTQPWVEACYEPQQVAELITAIEQGKQLQLIKVSLLCIVKIDCSSTTDCL
jgi:hypothetical protein